VIVEQPCTTVSLELFIAATRRLKSATGAADTDVC
jgi:hypothetical protein